MVRWCVVVGFVCEEMGRGKVSVLGGTGGSAWRGVLDWLLCCFDRYECVIVRVFLV